MRAIPGIQVIDDAATGNPFPPGPHHPTATGLPSEEVVGAGGASPTHTHTTHNTNAST